MMKRVTLLIAANAAFILPQLSFGAGELTADALVEKCASTSAPDRQICQVYLQGFVDGALSTDAKVAVNVADEVERGAETLTERAIRTRVRDRLARYGASVYADFCPPDPLPVTLLESAIVKDGQQAVPEQLARDLLYDVVRREFPCERLAQAP